MKLPKWIAKCLPSKDERSRQKKARKAVIKKALKTCKIEHMTKIPIEEKDLIDVPLYISMAKVIPVEWTIGNGKSDIKNSALRLIYDGEPEEAEALFSRMCQTQKWERDF